VAVHLSTSPGKAELSAHHLPLQAVLHLKTNCRCVWTYDTAQGDLHIFKTAACHRCLLGTPIWDASCTAPEEAPRQLRACSHGTISQTVWPKDTACHSISWSHATPSCLRNHPMLYCLGVREHILTRSSIIKHIVCNLR
jgi:hypothetical protein